GTNWPVMPLNDLIARDGIFVDGDWVESKDQDPSGQIRLIQLADIKEMRFISKSERFLTREKARQLGCTYLKQNDVLIARMPEPLGRACLFPYEESERYVTVVDVAIVRPSNPGVLPKWLMYFINAPQFRTLIYQNASGSTRLRISRKKLGQLRLPVPPLLEQGRIVAKLDQLFSHLDRINERLDKIPALLKQFRQAVLTQAFTGQLTDDWVRKNNVTPVDQMLLHITAPPKPSRYNSRTSNVIPGRYALSVGPPHIRIPNRYKWVELVSVARLETGHTPSRKHPEYWKGGDIPWIGIKDASEHHSKTIYSTYQKTNELGLANSAARLLPANTVCL